MKVVFNTKMTAFAGIVSLVMALGCGPGRSRTATPTASGDGGAAQRLVTLVDYISTDYKRAVANGKVVSEAEYAEQVRFGADAQAIAASLVGRLSDGEPDCLELCRIAAKLGVLP